MTQQITGITPLGLPLHGPNAPAEMWSLANSLAEGADTALQAVLRFRGCRVHRDGNFTFSDATAADVTFPQETIDTIGMHSTSVLTERLTVPAGYDGVWRVTGQVRFEAHASGRRQLVIRRGVDAVAIVANTPGAANTHSMQVSAVISAVEGDYFTLEGFQNRGGSLLGMAGEGNTWFSAEFLGPIA